MPSSGSASDRAASLSLMRRYAQLVVRYHVAIIVLTGLVTIALALQTRNLQVIIDNSATVPQQHPYVATSVRVEKLFGWRHVIVIGIMPKDGDVFAPAVMAKVRNLTTALLRTPGVVRGNVMSLTAPRAKSIRGTADGMEVRPLVAAPPGTTGDLDALREALRLNPVYVNSVVSTDGRTATVIAEFEDDGRGFRSMVQKVTALVNRIRDDSVDIALGGQPVFLAAIEHYSQRMVVLFPVAVLITGLIHYQAFRTMQGLILPLVTALLAVVWSLGIMGLARVPLDVFNVTTPILILAVAAGHAVQILKRYYEEFTRAGVPGREGNQRAVVESLDRIGPVMLTAGGIAAVGFLSLTAFETTTIRTFGVFTALGIVSALVLEMSFIPALRSMMPAPSAHERERESRRRLEDRLTELAARAVVGPSRKAVLIGAGAAVLVLLGGVGLMVVDNSLKGYFFGRISEVLDDERLNARLGGTNTMYLLVEGAGQDAIKNPAVLRAMEATQQFLEREPEVGKTVSIADFVRRMNRAMHGDDLTYDTIPDATDLVSQYLLLYSMSGTPSDFDSYVDYDYRAANIWVFLKTDRGAYLEDLIARLKAFVTKTFPPGVRVEVGGSVAQATALSEVMASGKIQNMVQIGGVILVVTSVVFRSPTAGLLVLLPLALAVLANFGVMGLTRIPLNTATAVIAAMAVGIGADYAIYLIYRIREQLAQDPDPSKAVAAAVTTAGKAILFVASAVAGGYGVLLLSWGFLPHLWFGILIGTSMLVSCLATLTVLPALILALRPRFLFGRR